MSGADDCNCWKAPAEDGTIYTGAWLGMHERIGIITRDGQRVVGRPAGPAWFTQDEQELPGLEVEHDDGSLSAIPLVDVDTITPIAAPDPVEILEAVARALRRPYAIEDGQIGWTAIASSHDVLEIEVKVRRAPCASATPNLPPFRFVVHHLKP